MIYDASKNWSSQLLKCAGLTLARDRGFKITVKPQFESFHLIIHKNCDKKISKPNLISNSFSLDVIEQVFDQLECSIICNKK